MTLGDLRIHLRAVLLGTANNIAKTLDIKKRPEILARSWGKKSTIFNTATVTFNTQKFPMGEGAGVGLFPYHILHMKSMKKASSQDLYVDDQLVEKTTDGK